jgi:serine kinase of HPr protein (carbohydrate metabolism regulator)
MSGGANVHATGLVLEGFGVMVRGPSGSGKSLLALHLLDAWTDRGLEARLVADDRLDLVVVQGRVFMRAPAAIAGLIELRGRGIVSRQHVGEAPVDLVVDLVPALERMPEEAAFSTDLLGVALPRCPVPQAGVVEATHQVMLVREALAAVRSDATKTA